MPRVTQDATRPRLASYTGLSPSLVELSRTFHSRSRCHSVVLQPRGCVATTPVWALPRSLATTGGIINLFSLPPGTKMFQFPGFASLHKVMIITLQVIGLSHSEIRGSQVICTYPRLIAAYRVLPRLREPRHPPCAFRNFHRCATLKKSTARSYFQLCRTPNNKVQGTTLIRVLFSTVSLCRNMSKIVWE